ncbi:MAG: hypothetical protein AAB019_11570, partial [Planctomycetota bacterium]
MNKYKCNQHFKWFYLILFGVFFFWVTNIEAKQNGARCNKCGREVGWDDGTSIIESSFPTQTEAWKAHEIRFHEGGGTTTPPKSDADRIWDITNSLMDDFKKQQREKEERDRQWEAEQEEKRQQEENARQSEERARQRKDLYEKNRAALKTNWSYQGVNFSGVAIQDSQEDNRPYGVQFQAYNANSYTVRVKIWLTKQSNLRDGLVSGEVEIGPGQTINLGWVAETVRYEAFSYGLDTSVREISVVPKSSKNITPSRPQLQKSTPQILRKEKTELEPTEKNIRAVPVPEFWENVKNQVKFSDPRAEQVKNEGIDALAQSPSGKEMMDWMVKEG